MTAAQARGEGESAGEEALRLRAKELLDYDSTTGLFRWIVDKNRTAMKGQIAGSITRSNNGNNIIIYIDRRKYYAHRLAWLMSYGHFPETVDHIDRDPTNNRLDNLRAAKWRENSCNSGQRKNNKSGIKGVAWKKDRSKWRARIKGDGIEIHLGYFDDKREAAHAYNKAAITWHGKFACLNPL